MWVNADPVSIKAHGILPLIVTLLFASSIFCVSFIDIKVTDAFLTSE